MTGPYSMFGYDEWGGSFVKADVDTDAAKAEAAAKNLKGYLLSPTTTHGASHNHSAYKRVGPGEYKGVPTRIFVFSHLLDPRVEWIPNKATLEAG